jgi:hypothetical protein
VIHSDIDFPILYTFVNQLQSLDTVAFLNPIALAFVASVGVNAGLCCPSSSTTLAALSIETTSTASSNAVSTATATDLGIFKK